MHTYNSIQWSSAELYLIVREPLTFLSHKALEEGHRDEEEEDDEEDCATDNSLWLRPDQNKSISIYRHQTAMHTSSAQFVYVYKRIHLHLIFGGFI